MLYFAIDLIALEQLGPLDPLGGVVVGEGQSHQEMDVADVCLQRCCARPQRLELLFVKSGERQDQDMEAISLQKIKDIPVPRELRIGRASARVALPDPSCPAGFKTAMLAG